MNFQFIIRIILLITISILTVFTSKAQLSKHLGDTLSTIFNEMAANYNLKGISAAVHFKDGSTWEDSYGNFGQYELHGELLHEAGSSTKTMVSACILQLQEEGELSIKDSIYTYLNPMKNVSYGITIEQLLNHTSGLANFTDNPAYLNFVNSNWTAELPVDSVMKNMLEAPLQAPGISFKYCNTGYLLLSMILETVEQKPLAQIFRERLFDPNELDEIYLSFYEPFNGIHLGTWIGDTYEETPSRSFLGSAWGAGGAVCEPADLARWAYLLYGGSLLQADSYQQLFDFFSIAGGKEMGLGVFKRNYRGETLYGHGGQTLQTSTMEYNIDQDYSIVVMGIEDNKYAPTNNLHNRLLYVLQTELPKIDITSVIEVEDQDVLKMYPNPASDIVHVEVPPNEVLNYRLVDASGKIVWQEEQKESSFILSVDAFEPGMYWLQSQSNMNWNSLPLVIQ